MALQDLHDGLGRTWCEGIRIATHDAGDVGCGDTVEILQRIHLAKHRCLVDLLRERTHHEDAVDLRILVDEVEDLLKLFVRNVFRKLIVLRLQAEIHEALLDATLIAEIGLLVADTQNRQRRQNAVVLSDEVQALALDLICDDFSS